jgi:hypothetical protein
MTSPAQRIQLAQLMDWLHEHRDRVHYPHGDIRTETVSDIHSVEQVHARVLRRAGWTVDCSQTVIALLLAVGLKVPDPNGYTGTLLADLPHYQDARAAYIGALAVYGPGSGHHVTMTRHRDTVHGNPVQFSQGQESDPRFISLLTEAQFQPHPVTMLSIAHL